MRELKFRDYDMDNKTMRYFDMDGYDRQEHDAWGNIMQYTGLKDKNGVEIYEGDILQFNTGTGRGFGEDNKDVVLPPVEFGTFYAKDVDLYKYNGFHIDGASIHYKLTFGCTVIGNIYQHPSLLTPKSPKATIAYQKEMLNMKSDIIKELNNGK